MRFLLHGQLNIQAVNDALVRHGHTSQTAEAAGFVADMSPQEVMAKAHQMQLDVISDDKELVSFARSNSVRFVRCLVYLQLEGEAVEQDDAIDRLFDRYKRLSTGRLYTVTETRVKVSQLPGQSFSE
jgi:hypothetical protein